MRGAGYRIFGHRNGVLVVPRLRHGTWSGSLLPTHTFGPSLMPETAASRRAWLPDGRGDVKDASFLNFSYVGPEPVLVK